MLPLTRNRSRSRFFSAGASAPPPPPSDPNWADVALLLNTTSTNGAQNNTFLDSSTNAFTVTRNGDTTQGSFTPFAVPSGQSYSAATYGGSGYFDGTGDFLTVASNAAFAYGTGDFTWECWFYTSVNSGYILDHGANGGTISFNSTTLIYYNSTTGIGSALYTTGFAANPALNTWHHIAAVRSGGTTSLYFNGTLSVAAADGHNYGSQAITIGKYGLGAFNFGGYISNLRLVKGTAVYTGNFTPPTAPLTAIANTSLLLGFTNAGIYDAATINNSQTVGNAQVSTTQAKFGTTSMAFDGTGDWIKIPNKPEVRFTNAIPFTTELFFYANALSATQFLVSAYNVSSPFQGWGIAFGANPLTYNQLQFWDGSVWRAIGTVSTNQWYHVAVTYEGSGTTGRVFLDGVQQGSAFTVSSNINNTITQLSVGSNTDGTNTFNGYIDELRITNGVARYTGNFTPPTAAFPTL